MEEERRTEPPRKQRLTAGRIHRIRLKEERPVSDRTVWAVVREVRDSLRDPLERAYVPLAYEPSEDAQVDFLEAEVQDDDESRTMCHVLIVRACRSRRGFRYAAPNQTRKVPQASAHG